jgi:hypothetical protein
MNSTAKKDCSEDEFDSEEDYSEDELHSEED